jgi:hypothetical protein
MTEQALDFSIQVVPAFPMWGDATWPPKAEPKRVRRKNHNPPRWTAQEDAALEAAFYSSGDMYRHYIRTGYTMTDWWHYVAGVGGMRRTGKIIMRRWNGPSPEEAHGTTLLQHLEGKDDPLMARAAEEIRTLRKQLKEGK